MNCIATILKMNKNDIKIQSLNELLRPNKLDIKKHFTKVIFEIFKIL